MVSLSARWVGFEYGAADLVWDCLWINGLSPALRWWCLQWLDLLTDRASLNIHQFNEIDEHISLLILERSDKAIRHVLAILMNEIRRICCRVIVNRHKSYGVAAAADEKIILNRSLCSNESDMRYEGRWEGLVQRVSSVLIVVDYIGVLIWIEWKWWNRWWPS